MRCASSFASAVAVLVLVHVAPAQAAPIGSPAGNIEVTGENADIIKVRHRCYWHRGHLHCPRHRHYRQYYYGPGFYFGSGPRRHYRHHHRRHW
jgi:hypothetical protein